MKIARVTGSFKTASKGTFKNLARPAKGSSGIGVKAVEKRSPKHTARFSMASVHQSMKSWKRCLTSRREPDQCAFTGQEAQGRYGLCCQFVCYTQHVHA